MHKFVSIYLVISGIVGFVTGLLWFLTGESIITSTGMTIVGASSLMAGISLYREDHQLYWLGYLVLILQVPILSMTSFVYRLYLFISFILYINLPLRIGFNFDIGSGFTISSGRMDEAYKLIGVNIISLIMLLLLHRVIRANDRIDQIVINEKNNQQVTTE
jgi:hypothetical protein